MQNPVAPEGYEWLEQDDFSSNRHLALMPWFVACPGAKTGSTFGSTRSRC